MNPQVDIYFSDGCGRCSLGGTPQCKVHKWQQELEELRMLALECGLTEERKWGVPCYSFQKSNIVIIGAFKEYCTLGFFKGVLLNDAHKILSKPGEDSQSSRTFKFTDVRELRKNRDILKAYIYEAIEAEKAGLKVNFKKITEQPVPEEFQKKLNENSALNSAFRALTPGRQRGYLLYFSQAKQPKTREARIEKCLPLIFSGKGLNDDYKKRN